MWSFDGFSKVVLLGYLDDGVDIRKQTTSQITSTRILGGSVLGTSISPVSGSICLSRLIAALASVAPEWRPGTYQRTIVPSPDKAPMGQPGLPGSQDI